MFMFSINRNVILPCILQTMIVNNIFIDMAYDMDCSTNRCACVLEFSISIGLFILQIGGNVNCQSVSRIIWMAPLFWIFEALPSQCLMWSRLIIFFFGMHSILSNRSYRFNWYSVSWSYIEPLPVKFDHDIHQEQMLWRIGKHKAKTICRNWTK